MGHSSACRRACLVGALFSILLGLGAGFAHAAGAAPTPACTSLISGSTAPTITKASNAADGGKTVSLGDVVALEGKNLEKLFSDDCTGRQVVLFMNDWPLKDVQPLPPVDPVQGKLKFKLINRPHATTDDNSWLPILGRPGFSPVKVRLSVGFDNGFAMQGDQKTPLPELSLQVIPLWWFLFWFVILLGMVAVFLYLAFRTTMLRDPAPPIAGASGPFSLSRTQGAAWFFVILAAYLFIGMITGDFSESVNGTALILLGIGAGTVIGSTVIDAQKDQQNQAATQKAIRDVRAELNRTATQLGGFTARLRGLPEDSPARTRLEADQIGVEAEAEKLKSQLKKLRGISENFLTDILSDANGISFHRFQIAAWTLVLSIIFAVGVWQNLTMPTFNTTLMGLLGLSAGTYLGLKIPEPVVPK